MDKLTKRLRDTREDRELTQEQIANILHTSQRVYSRYETGVRALPLEHLYTLCLFYNITPEYFLGFTNKPSSLPKK